MTIAKQLTQNDVLTAWGASFRLSGTIRDQETPYFDGLALRFLEHFALNTPPQSIEAFFMSMLAEQDVLVPTDPVKYPQQSAAEGKAPRRGFPSERRAEYADYRDKMTHRRVP